MDAVRIFLDGLSGILETDQISIDMPTRIAYRTSHGPESLLHEDLGDFTPAVVARPKLILADEPTGNLDSRHGEEVMKMLTELNEAGTTIIMVTHSPDYADYAQRVVHLFDGHVVTENITRSTHA